MKKQWEITEEEFEALKDAIINVLSLWQFDFVSASNEHGSEISMSKEEFFKGLEHEFIIKRSPQQEE